MPEPLLRALDLTIARRVEGMLPGDHRSSLLGRGSELAQIRPYEPVEDDVRQIDWNVTARTGTPHVRIHLAERALVTWLVLDTSPSMTFGTAERRKADVAEGASLAVGYAATRRGNRLGLVTFGDDNPRILPARQGRAGLLGLLLALAQGGRSRAAPQRGRGDLGRGGAQAGRHAGAAALVHRRGLRFPRSSRLAPAAARARWPPSRGGDRDPRRTRAGAAEVRPAAPRRSRDRPAAEGRQLERPVAQRTSQPQPPRSAARWRRRSPRPVRATSCCMTTATGCATSPASSVTRARDELRVAHRPARRCCSCRWRSRATSGSSARRVREAPRLRPAGAAAERRRPGAGLAPAPAGGDPAARGRELPARLRAAARDALGALRGGDRRDRDRHLALDGRDRRRARRGSPLRRPRRAASSPSCPRSTASPSSPSARARSSWRRRRRTASSSTRRSAALRVGEGTALGDGDRDLGQGRRGDAAGREAAGGRRRRRPPPSWSSRTARRTAGASSSPSRSAGRARRRCPSSRRCSGRPPASCRCRTSAATSSASRCRPNPAALRAVAAQTGGATSQRRRRTTSRPSTPISSRASARRTRTRRSRSPSRAPARSSCSSAGALSALWFRRVP